jgi:hypothetical protein
MLEQATGKEIQAIISESARNSTIGNPKNLQKIAKYHAILQNC